MNLIYIKMIAQKLSFLIILCFLMILQCLQLQKTKTWDTFTKDRLEKMSDSRINTCVLAKIRFDAFLYSEHKIDTEGFIKHVKSIDEEHMDNEMFSVLQSWIDWLSDRFDLNSGSTKQYLSGMSFK